MLTFISFIIVMMGSLNWFFIGAFQYDFVAGFFGSQASLLSRFVYFVVGMAAFVLLAMALKNKGKIKLTENSFKPKNSKTNNSKQQEHQDKRKDEIHYTENLNNFNQEKTNNIHNKSENNQKAEKETEVAYGYKDFDVTQYDE
jgi:uncharacterized membrane protein YuzA (DUF378 family)